MYGKRGAEIIVKATLFLGAHAQYDGWLACLLVQECLGRGDNRCDRQVLQAVTGALYLALAAFQQAGHASRLSLN